jgi:hypothetical protein
MAEALVGVGHPLVRAIHAYKAVRDQIAVIAALQLVSAVLLYEKAPFALPFAVASGSALAVLSYRLAVLRSRRRDVCRELIIRGGEWLPLAAVQAESRRLRSSRHQARLSRAVDEIADLADRRLFQSPTAAVVCHVSVLERFVPELREIAFLLLAGGGAVRGVALVERLLLFGDSPIYGTEVETLRRELSRARALLGQQS